MRFKKTILFIMIAVIVGIGLYVIDPQDEPLEAKHHGKSKVTDQTKHDVKVEDKTQSEKVQEVKDSKQKPEPKPDPKPKNNQPAEPEQEKTKEITKQSKQDKEENNQNENIPNEYKGITLEHIKSLTKQERSTIPKEIKEVFHIAGDGTLALKYGGYDYYEKDDILKKEIGVSRDTAQKELIKEKGYLQKEVDLMNFKQIEKEYKQLKDEG